MLRLIHWTKQEAQHLHWKGKMRTGWFLVIQSSKTVLINVCGLVLRFLERKPKFPITKTQCSWLLELSDFITLLSLFKCSSCNIFWVWKKQLIFKRNRGKQGTFYKTDQILKTLFRRKIASYLQCFTRMEMTLKLYEIHENLYVLYGVSIFKLSQLCQELASPYSTSKQFLCSILLETTYRVYL